MVRNRLTTGTSILALLWLFLVGACDALAVSSFDGPAPREINFKPSVLATLAEALSRASDEERRTFARIALVEMSAAYEDELKRASQAEPKTQAARKKLARWRFATRRYLVELGEIARALDATDSLRLHVDRQQRVLMFVGEHPIIVNGPRIGKKEALEQRILEAFCLAHPCDVLLATDSQSEPEPQYPAGGTWALGHKRRPRYETVDGLLFEFRNMSDRALKEQACLAIIPELRELATALQKAREARYAIDWPGLAIEPIPASEDHRVILNRQGDFLRLSLPRLEKAEEFWREALPWLRARANGKDYRMRFPNSERLLHRASAGRH
jgi:hypothetical protein